MGEDEKLMILVETSKKSTKHKKISWAYIARKLGTNRRDDMCMLRYNNLHEKKDKKAKNKCLSNIYNQISSDIVKNKTNTLNKHIVKRNKYRELVSTSDLNEWLNELSTLYTPLVVRYKVNNDLGTKTLLQDKRLYLILWIRNNNNNKIKFKAYISGVILSLLKYKCHNNNKEFEKEGKKININKNNKILKIFEKKTIIIYELIILAAFRERFTLLDGI